MGKSLKYIVSRYTLNVETVVNSLYLNVHFLCLATEFFRTE